MAGAAARSLAGGVRVNTDIQARADATERRAAFALLVRSAAPDRSALRTATLWLVLAAAMEALGPLLGKTFIDRYLLPRHAAVAAPPGPPGGAPPGVFLGGGGGGGGARRGGRRRRELVSGHVLRLPMAFFDRAITGAL